MKKPRLVTAALLVAASLSVVALAGPARADGGGMPCGQHGAMDPVAHVAKLTPLLGLTAQQQTAAKKMAQEMAAKAQPLVQLGDSQHEEIRALLESQSPDPAQIGRKVIAMHGTHQQLEALHQEGRARFERLLTAQQRAKLSQLHGPHGHPAGHGDLDD